MMTDNDIAVAQAVVVETEGEVETPRDGLKITLGFATMDTLLRTLAGGGRRRLEAEAYDKVMGASTEYLRRYHAGEAADIIAEKGTNAAVEYMVTTVVEEVAGAMVEALMEVVDAIAAGGGE